MDYFERLAAHYHSLLGTETEGYRWLRNRGISDDSIQAFQLGYVQDASNGLQRFNGAISIPYLRPQVKSGMPPIVASLRFRHLGDRGPRPKYDAIRGTKAHLFNVAATDAEHVYITEGEFDTVILSQLGYAAVGVPGASLFQPSWKYLFAAAGSVTLVFDGDEAGEKGSQRIASILGEVCPTIRRALLPGGQDVTDMYLNRPRDLVKAIS